MIGAESSTPLAESLRRLETLQSPYTGIVRSAHELLAAPDDARLVNVGCEIAAGSGLLGASLSHLDGGSGGSHVHAEAARAAALGEAAERYSATYLPEPEFVLASAEELGAEAADPERFALFREDQYAGDGFPFSPFGRSTPVRWVRGVSLTDRRPAYLPVQLVYLSWASLAPGETWIGYSTSSGLACGATFAEAVLSGLLELVERDAFMLTWYNRLSLPRLDWRPDRALVELERRHFAPTRLRYEVVDLSVFLGVPTALGVVHGGPADVAALGVGAGSAATIQEAWRKALAEAFSVRAWARSLRLAEPKRTFRTDFRDVETFSDHILFYACQENARHAAFLDSSEERRDVREVPALEGASATELIGAIAARLGARGIEAYAVDVTSPDVRQAGLSVAKVLAPELCPLDVAYQARFLGGRRLYAAGWELGLRRAPLAPEDVNPYPHPFP